MSSYRQRTAAPTVIGADLIQEARQVEKEWTLIAVRKAVEALAVSVRDSRDSWKWNDRTATQFRTDVLSALAAMEDAR